MDHATPRDPAAGFSLLEMVVVLAIAGFLLSVVLPTYSNYASNQRTLAAARTLASDLRAAQQEAVTRRAEITVTFSSADAACTSGGAHASYTITQGAAVIKRTCISSDVEWAPQPEAPVTFQSTGAAPVGATLTMRSARTSTRHTVTIQPGTGAVSDGMR